MSRHRCVPSWKCISNEWNLNAVNFCPSLLWFFYAFVLVCKIFYSLWFNLPTSPPIDCQQCPVCQLLHFCVTLHQISVTALCQSFSHKSLLCPWRPGPYLWRADCFNCGDTSSMKSFATFLTKIVASLNGSFLWDAVYMFQSSSAGTCSRIPRQFVSLPVKSMERCPLRNLTSVWLWLIITGPPYFQFNCD